MSRSRMTSGKRQREQQKREKAQAKVQRRAARQDQEPEEDQEPMVATEEQLVDELAALHRAFEANDIPHQEFEDRREQIRLQIERLES